MKHIGSAWLAAAILASQPSHAQGQGNPASTLLEPEKLEEIGASGESVGFGHAAIWIASAGRLTRLGTVDHAATETRLDTSGGPCRNIVVSDDAVWVPDCGHGIIYKVDPATTKVLLTIEADMFSTEGTIAVGEGSLWVITAENGERTLSRYDTETGEPEGDIPLPGSGTCVAVYNGFVWVTAPGKGSLYRIDPRRNTVIATVQLGGVPRFASAGEGSIWVWNEALGAVQRVEAGTGSLIATIKVGAPGLGDVSVGGGAVWVKSPDVLAGQIDPKSNKVVRIYRSNYPLTKCYGVLYGGDSLWLLGPRLTRIRAVP
jgi:virginiamycin B lyase